MRLRSLLFLLIIFCSGAVNGQRLTLPVRDSMKVSKSLLPGSHFYTQHLGFFCKKELQLQKRTALNIYFRLGSKDYVDYLEQKPNARR